jgi:hypothetical protein
LSLFSVRAAKDLATKAQSRKVEMISKASYFKGYAEKNVGLHFLKCIPTFFAICKPYAIDYQLITDKLIEFFGFYFL